MARCLTCTHREHAAIDLALARGVSVRELSRRYGITERALYYHRKDHLPPHLRAKLIGVPELDIDLDKLRETEGQSLLSHLIAIRNRLFAGMDQVAEPLVPRFAAALHQNLEMIGKLVGSLGTGGNTTINNILITSDYVEMRVALLRALDSYPDAKIAVAQTLHAIEDKAAKTITLDKREFAR
jgi:hypothetical protein